MVQSLNPKPRMLWLSLFAFHDVRILARNSLTSLEVAEELPKGLGFIQTSMEEGLGCRE